MTTIEAREAQWRQHIQNQNHDYETFGRFQSDKKSIGREEAPGDFLPCSRVRPAAGPAAAATEASVIATAPQDAAPRQRREQREKRDGKEKKEKKEKKKRDPASSEATAAAANAQPPTVLRGPTFLAPRGSASPQAEAAPLPAQQDASAETAGASREEADAAAPGSDPAAPAVEAVAAPAAKASDVEAYKSVRKSGDLRWPDLVLAVRALLLAGPRGEGGGGRVSAADLPALFEGAYGYAVAFPFFGLPDWDALLQELQPGALTVVARRGGAGAQLVQASGEAAFLKEQASWGTGSSQESQRQGTATEWLVAGLERELKAVRQSVGERRRAQKDAEAQAEKVRQEYAQVTANQRGRKSEHQRRTKADLDKQEQRAAKFRLEAEGFENQERALAASVRRELGLPEAPAPHLAYALDGARPAAAQGVVYSFAPQGEAAAGSASSSAAAGVAPAAPTAREVGGTSSMKAVEDDFM